MEVEARGFVAAHDHGEGVFEAEAGFDFDFVSLIVELRDGGEDGGFVVGGWERLFEDGGEGGAAVFDVGVDATGDEGLMAEIAAGEVEAAFDFLRMAFACELGFDLLREQFAEDDLLGEVFGSDDDGRGAWGGAGCEGQEEE